MNAGEILERPGEACGVFGIHAPGSDVARLTYFGLFALQHRGQESAGIAVSDAETLTVYKDLGLVAQVFDETTLAGLSGTIAVGHTRYSTTGSSVWENSQTGLSPDQQQRNRAVPQMANLTNTRLLSDEMGKMPGSTDSELMAEAIAEEMLHTDDLAVALQAALPRLEGAFTIAVMDRDHLVGARDRHGFRPLCLGRHESGWVIASETAALDIIGARFVRDVEPGEMVVIDESGLTSSFPFAAAEPRMCLFEFRLLRPPGLVSLWPERARRTAANGRAPCRSGSGRSRCRRASTGVGHPGRPGICRRCRAPVLRRARQEPVRRPYLHRAGTVDA